MLFRYFDSVNLFIVAVIGNLKCRRGGAENIYLLLLYFST